MNRSKIIIIVMFVILPTICCFFKPSLSGLDYISVDAQYPLNPSFEFTNDPTTNSMAIKPYAEPANVLTMNKLQKLERIGLVEPVGYNGPQFLTSETCS